MSFECAFKGAKILITHQKCDFCDTDVTFYNRFFRLLYAQLVEPVFETNPGFPVKKSRKVSLFQTGNFCYLDKGNFVRIMPSNVAINAIEARITMQGRLVRLLLCSYFHIISESQHIPGTNKH